MIATVNDTLIKNLKHAKKDLETEINFDKATGVDPKDTSMNFVLPSDSDIEMFSVASLLSAPQLRVVTNVNVHYVDDPNSDTKDLVLNYYNKPVHFSPVDTLKVVNKLLDLGVDGIKKRFAINKKKRARVAELENSMNI